MNLYAIRRKRAWASPQELEQVAGRSRPVADDDFPSDIRWIRRRRGARARARTAVLVLTAGHV